MSAADQPYIFVSYASGDRDRAITVAAALERAGIAVWLDRRSIAGGNSWSAEIVAGVKGCAALLLLVSPAALASPNVGQEVQLAWEARRPLLPLLLERAPLPPAIEYTLAGRQWVEVLERPASAWQSDLLRALAGLGLPRAMSVPPPAPAAPDAPAMPRHNLPRQLTSFVGREAAIAAVSGLLADAALVTLTGVGGTGKTRLAFAVAERALPAYPEGVWLAELAPLADPGLVAQAVAAVLGVREQPGEPLATTLARALQPRHLLLVLDNCEHLIDASARLAEELLQHCPRLRVLATSREQLGVPGEAAYRVPSLALPTPDAGAATLGDNEAARLFVARAQAARPGFALSDANAPLVAQLCARLDGIPLALELAAARLRALPLEQLAARLDDRFRLLTGGSRTALPRQQTLQATLDWNYRLLAEDERALLRRLSVFAGGWTLDAAEVVCGGEPWRVLDLLTGLVDKSLVTLDETPAAPRYRLLETVRQYARERLAETDEGAAVRDRHRDWSLALAEEAAPLLTTGAQAGALGRLDAEADNRRAALAWSQAGDAAAGLRLAAALHRHWYYRGLLGEGIQWLASFLDQVPEPTVVRAVALGGLGLLVMNDGTDLARAEAAYRESEALSRTLALPQSLLMAVRNRGITLLAGQGARAGELVLREALALSREHGDRWSEGIVQRFLGVAAWMGGELPRGLALLEESRTILRATGDRQPVINTDIVLIMVCASAGDYERALLIADAAEREAGEGGFVHMLVSVTIAHSEVAWRIGRLAEAVACGERALALARGQGRGPALEATLCLARAALAVHDLARAHTLLAEIDAASTIVHQAVQIRYWSGRAGQQAGEAARAARQFGAAVRLAWETGLVIFLPDHLEAIAALLVSEGSATPATRLLAAMAGFRATRGLPRPPVEQSGRDATLASARAALGEAAFADAWAAGATLTLEEAVAEALARLDDLAGEAEGVP